jgi:cobyrinic acid a,c-diamide synthase
VKGLVVCGTGSGVGKTTISAGLMAAVRKRGLRVQPFKCGPDFIDPGHHARVCGRPSHNLDTWMLSADQNKRIFASACQGADIAIVEGMMGLFDGVRGKGEDGSSAELAKLLGLPVLLVVDASSAARSVAAVVHGFRTFDPQLRIAGVILNRVAGHNHARMLIEALRSLDPRLVIGWIPSDQQVGLRERHLGLETAEERSWTSTATERLASLVEEGAPLDQLLQSCNFELASEDLEIENFPAPVVRIGIARDRAFCFYYEAALAELRRHGAELVEFSPLTDSKLPNDVDGLYFGGGYPELYAETLSANAPLLADLRKFAERGNPIYGECGGLMFLGRQLLTPDGRRWPMANLLPLSVEMTEKLVHFGYAEIRFLEDGFAEMGACLRGHSFHYSRIIDHADIEKRAVVHYSLSGETQEEGFTAGNVFGSYIHLHFAGDPRLAARFISMARQRREVEA